MTTATRFPLSARFYYSGAIDYAGDRTTLRHLQSQVREGWEVYAIDLHPGSYSHPYRVFVGTTGSRFHPRAEHEAMEALLEYCRSNPESAIAGHVFSWEVDAEDLAAFEADPDNAPELLTREGRTWREGEEAICGIGLVTDPDALSSLPGGKWERKVSAAIPQRSPDLKDAEIGAGFYVWAWQPGVGESPTSFPQADTPIGAWKAAAQALGLVK